eukprot:NODE_160_length_16633_cov_0.230132.p1 type:complete len:1061 gc:universal NODE_160_length_16633_cov_0.230132:12381-15563(+)
METVADRLFILTDFGNKAIRVLYSHVKLYNFISNPTEQDSLFGDASIPMKTGLSLLLDANYQPLYKALLKKFPDIRDIPKSATAVLEQNQKTFIDGLQSMYNSMSIFLQFQNDALDILKIADKIQYLNSEITPDLCMMILDVVKQIVFGQQLICSLGERRKILVSAYAKAYFLENGINEPLFRTLADLCMNVEKVQQYLIEIFQPVNNIVHMALNALQLDYTSGAGISADTLRKTKSLRFSGSFKMGNMSEPIYDDKTFRMLYYIERLTENIISAALACPNDLVKENASHVCGFAVTVTDKLYLSGDTFLELFSEFEQIAKISNKSTKTVKVINDSIQNVASRTSLHLDRREAISKLLADSILTVKSDNGFLATRLPTILSLLSLGYHELVYYFKQFERLTPRRTKTANSPGFSWTSIQLLHNLVQLYELIVDNMSLINQYYIEMLRTTYASELNEYLNIIQTSSEPEVIKNMWNDIHLSLKTLKSPDSKSLYSIRMTWLRLQVYFATQSPPSNQSTQSIIAKVMNEICLRSRFIDNLSSELDLICPLHNLFYFRYSLMDHIVQFTTMPIYDDIHVQTSRSIMSCVMVAKYFTSLTSFESKTSKQHERLQNFTKFYVDTATHLLIDAATFNMHSLNLEFARLYLLSHSFGQQSLLTEEEKRVMVMPGFESMLNHKNASLLKWASQQFILNGLVSSFKNPFLISNTLFTPMIDFIKSYNKIVVGVLRTSILESPNSASGKDSGNSSPYNIYAKDSPIMQQATFMIKRPTLFLTGLMGYFENLKKISVASEYDYMFGVSQLLRDQSNLITANLELNQVELKGKNNKRKVDTVDKLLVTQLINWLMEVIGSKTVAQNFGISPIRKSLESYGSDPFPLHHFICYKEFYAISECVGPNARIILREKIYSVAKNIFDELFVAIKPVYDAIESEKGEKSDAKVMELIGKQRLAPEYNDWMLQFGTLGMLFELEDLLSEAFSDSMEENSSYLKAVVEHGDLSSHPKLPELVEMLSSSGIKSTSSKSKLQMAALDIKRFTTTLAIFMTSVALDETLMYYPFHGSTLLLT